jgi:glutathione S-transferase
MLIYQLPISLYSFKLRLALRLKGAAIALSDPPGGSYRSAEYRAINPAGTIPALADGDRILTESDAIIEYLDDIGFGRPLRPADPWLAARHRMLSRWSDLRLEPVVRRLFPLVAAAGRDAALLAKADAEIAAALALIEGAIDPEAAHALADRPGLADCGLAAVMAWLQPLAGALTLQAAPGPGLERVAAALAAHPDTAAEVEEYCLGVEAWIAARR